MVSVTVSIPEDVRDIMKKFPEVNWSALVRKTIIEEVRKRELKEKLLGQLDNDKEFNDWAVKVVREGRRNENSRRH
jgi:hypothetical protein